MLWVWPVCYRAVVPTMGVRAPQGVTKFWQQNGNNLKSENHSNSKSWEPLQHRGYCREQYLKITLIIRQFSLKYKSVEQMAYRKMYANVLWYVSFEMVQKIDQCLSQELTSCPQTTHTLYSSEINVELKPFFFCCVHVFGRDVRCFSAVLQCNSALDFIYFSQPSENSWC